MNIDELVKKSDAVLTERAADRDAAYRQELAGVRDELRVVAERSRLQIPALEAVRKETLRFADATDVLAQRMAGDGAPGDGQTLANWTSDLRAAFFGGGRGGFASTPPLAESREHLAIYDDARAFARLFTPAVLKDVNARRTVMDQFRGALGRVDGHLSSVRTLRGRIEKLLADYNVADRPQGVVRTAPAVTRPERPVPLRVETEFDPRVGS